MTVTSALVTFCLMVIIAVLLWYRNLTYDRLFAGFIFIVGLVFLIEYGVYNGINPGTAGKMLSAVSWLQIFVLAIGVYVVLRNITSGIIAIITALIVVFIVFMTLTKNKSTLNSESILSSQTGCPKTGPGDAIWNSANINSLIPIYLIGIIIPFLLLIFTPNSVAYNPSSSDKTRLYLFAIYMIISIIIVTVLYNKFNVNIQGVETKYNNIVNMWFCMMVGFSLVVYFAGIWNDGSVKS